MANKTKPIIETIPELELPEISSKTLEQLPEPDKEGKVTFVPPELDLQERRSCNGPTMFFSFFSGSKYAKGEGKTSDGQTSNYIETWNAAGKIFMSQSGRKIFMTPLDFIALLELAKQHEPFLAYQVKRQRADIKQELIEKGKYL